MRKKTTSHAIKLKIDPKKIEIRLWWEFRVKRLCMILELVTKENVSNRLKWLSYPFRSREFPPPCQRSSFLLPSSSTKLIITFKRNTEAWDISLISTLNSKVKQIKQKPERFKTWFRIETGNCRCFWLLIDLNWKRFETVFLQRLEMRSNGEIDPKWEDRAKEKK